MLTKIYAWVLAPTPTDYQHMLALVPSFVADDPNCTEVEWTPADAPCGIAWACEDPEDGSRWYETEDGEVFACSENDCATAQAALVYAICE